LHDLIAEETAGAEAGHAVTQTNGTLDSKNAVEAQTHIPVELNSELVGQVGPQIKGPVA